MSRKRKTSKEVRCVKLQVRSITQAEADAAAAAPPVENWSATMPAYCYTAACPDPELREPIWKRYRRQPSIRAAKVEKICLICRKRWPAESGRKNCDCEREGRLYVLGAYNHPRAGGGTVDSK